MVLSSTNLDNIVALVWIKLFDSDWVALVELAADSELAVVVEPPSKQLVFVVKIETALFSAKDIYCVFGSNFFNFHRLAVFITSVQQPPNFS